MTLSSFSLLGFTQKIGEIRTLKLILTDVPISGDAIQAHFVTKDSREFSFDSINWLDKHISLFEFYHTYRDSCLKNKLNFEVTMIYIPMETYIYQRYEGYFPTGETANQWALTSIVKAENVIVDE